MNTCQRNKGSLIKLLPADYTVVDIETTGLSPQKCEIIEISALKVRNDRIVDTFSSLIKPSKPVSSFITKLTGITNDMVNSAPDIKSVLPKFLKFTGEDFLLGHNVNFDINFIYDNLKKYFRKDFTNNFIDTMHLSRKYCDLRHHNLKALAEYYKISAEGHHRALNDCNITFNIYKSIKKDAASQQNVV